MGNRRNRKRIYDRILDDNLHKKSRNFAVKIKNKDATIEGMLDDYVNRDLHNNIDEINVDDQIQNQEIEAGTCIHYMMFRIQYIIVYLNDSNFQNIL